MDFGLRAHDIGNNLDEVIENAKKANVHKLQFALAKTVNDIDFYKFGYNRDLSLNIKEKFDRNNLTVSVLGCYINPVERDIEILEKNLTLFENFILYARDFDARVIATETGAMPTSDETRSKENYDYFIKNLKRLVKCAEDNNVTIAIEPVDIFTVNSPETMARVLADINSPNLAVIFDLANIINAEDYGNQHGIIDLAFDLFGDKIKVIHLKDFVIENGIKRFADIGTGMYDIEYMFEKISSLSNMPDIILDETEVTKYSSSAEFLIKHILNIK